MHPAENRKRTNVRLSAAVLAILGALGGCATLPPLAAQRDECGVGLEAVCATFGPERSCECVTRPELDRFLTAFGEPAWLGGTP
jgi:hypothetical protein